MLSFENEHSVGESRPRRYVDRFHQVPAVVARSDSRRDVGAVDRNAFDGTVGVQKLAVTRRWRNDNQGVATPVVELREEIPRRQEN